MIIVSNKNASSGRIIKEVDQTKLFSVKSSETSKPIIDSSLRKPVKIWKLFVIFAFVLAIGGGGYIYRDGILKMINPPVSEPENMEVLTPSPTLTPTPPAEMIDVSKYKVKVLNGGGIKGEAAKVKKILESDSFVVSSVGNNDKQNIKKTTIQVKLDFPEEIAMRLDDLLKHDYAASTSSTLKETDEFDVIVIVGSEKTEQ